MRKKNLKIGLALGGGGALGMAHIGVLEVLEENGIKIDMIAGISMGAIIAGAYASGLQVKEMYDYAIKLKTANLFDINLKRGGFLSGASAEKWLKHVIKVNDFSETKIPFACVATDLISGSSVVLNKGNIIKSVRASMSVPALFRPVEMDDYVLVDGGLLGNVPAKVVKDMGADIVIAVDVLGDYRPSKKPNSMVGTLFDCTFLQISQFTKAALNDKDTDYVIDLNLGYNNQQTFSKGHTIECIQIGREVTKQNISAIKDLILKKQTQLSGKNPKSKN